jgi:hypothetical protein
MPPSSRPLKKRRSEEELMEIIRFRKRLVNISIKNLNTDDEPENSVARITEMVYISSISQYQYVCIW